MAQPDFYLLIELLAWGLDVLQQTDSRTARLDTELLLAECLGFSRAQLLARLDQKVEPALRNHFISLIKRRKLREPVAYILGRQYFYGREFFVDRRVLIPRPETEELVERVLAASRGSRVADIGTGSGAIAVTLAAEKQNINILATDISPAALEVAKMNAQRHQVSNRIAFYQGSLLEPLIGEAPFDLLVANLPYVGTDEMELLDVTVKEYEPHLALFAGAKGLALFAPFFEQLRRHALLQPGGTVLLEIGYAQGKVLAQLAASYFPHARQITIHKDLAHHDRFVELRL
jgi:release factor glutamine methyltransferase